MKVKKIKKKKLFIRNILYKVFFYWVRLFVGICIFNNVIFIFIVELFIMFCDKIM